ncbi:hypothetical protein GW17_00016823 [Ensete ventricosum]|nr:hypothetical protein GW17_00016823 [Ensete ventricosum]
MGTVYTRRYVSVRHQTDTRTACYQAIPLIRVVYASLPLEISLWYQPREKEEEGEEEEREEKGEPRDPALLFRSRAVVEASRGDFFSPHGLLEMFVLPVQGEETSPRMGRRNKATLVYTLQYVWNAEKRSSFPIRSNLFLYPVPVIIFY